MDTVNGMCSDAPRAKKCKCGKSPTIFDMESGCQIYCANRGFIKVAERKVKRRRVYKSIITCTQILKDREKIAGEHTR